MHKIIPTSQLEAPAMKLDSKISPKFIVSLDIIEVTKRTSIDQMTGLCESTSANPGLLKQHQHLNNIEMLFQPLRVEGSHGRSLE